MDKLKVGIIGLGNIAQSTYLPLLSVNEHVEIIGAFSPSVEKAKRLCAQYRITFYDEIASLIDAVDAVFVHSSTSTHYQIVKQALEKNKHVYVDKPLAETVEQAETLISLAKQKDLKLLVGFNRRFAPEYLKLKANVLQQDFQYLRVEKHRMGLSKQPIFDILLDDYIHLVDTVCWLANEALEIAHVNLQKTAQDELQFISVHYQGKQTKKKYLETISHRNAGTDLERISIIADNNYVITADFLTTTTIQNGITTTSAMRSLRQTDYHRRGFTGIVDEFVQAILENRTLKNSAIDGAYAQKLIEQLKAYI